MPIGSPAAVLPVVKDLHARPSGSIREVLDLGIGFGLWGAMLRNWLDFGVVSRRTFRLTGVEAFSQYSNPNWGHYDRVFNLTIDQFLGGRNPAKAYDVILLLDVIEHFDKAKGENLLNSLKPRLSPGGALYVATPSVFYSQGAEYGNQHEVHRSLWTTGDFEAMGFAVLDAPPEGQTPVYGHDCITVKYVRSSHTI